MQTPTIEETVCWVVLGIIALVFVLCIPFLNNYCENKEAERMLGRNDETF